MLLYASVRQGAVAEGVLDPPPARKLPLHIRRVARDDRDMTAAEFTNGHPALAEFWHPVALSSEVGAEPVAVRLAGQGWALARFDGTVRAFVDACPHRRARLSAGFISDGTLHCPYHGWRFTAEGRCVLIPALEDERVDPGAGHVVRPAEVTERDGLVWLAPKPPRAPMPELTSWRAAQWRGHRDGPAPGAERCRPTRRS